MRGIRRGATIAAATAVAALTAATALAGPGSTVSKSTTLSGNGPATRGATCPVGTRATGAGFSIVGAFNPQTNNGTRSMIQSMARTGIRSFSATAAMQPANQPSTAFRSYRPLHQSRPRVRSPTLSATPRSTREPSRSRTRRSPAGREGDRWRLPRHSPFAPPPGGKAIPFILESRRVGSQVWRTTLMNPQPSVTGPGATFRFWAMCERGRQRRHEGPQEDGHDRARPPPRHRCQVPAELAYGIGRVPARPDRQTPTCSSDSSTAPARRAHEPGGPARGPWERPSRARAAR